MNEQLIEPTQARFNEGFFKIWRLGKLKESCHDARLNRDYNKWFTCLQGIRSEIHSKLNKKQKKQKPNEVTERDIADQYEEAINSWLSNKKDNEVNICNQKGKIKNLNVYNVLYAYELWLEDMKDKYKIGMPDEDSAMTALK